MVSSSTLVLNKVLILPSQMTMLIAIDFPFQILLAFRSFPSTSLADDTDEN